jgi:hypothetical protein
MKPPRADSSLGKTNYQYSLFADRSRAAEAYIVGLVNRRLRPSAKAPRFVGTRGAVPLNRLGNT